MAKQYEQNTQTMLHKKMHYPDRFMHVCFSAWIDAESQRLGPSLRWKVLDSGHLARWAFVTFEITDIPLQIYIYGITDIPLQSNSL